MTWHILRPCLTIGIICFFLWLCREDSEDIKRKQRSGE